MPPTPPIVLGGIVAGTPAAAITTPIVALAPLMWAQTSAPAAGSAATASRATSAGNSHVCCGIFAVATVTTLLAAGKQFLVVLRDGAAGGGTIFWQALIALPNGAAVGVSSSVVVGNPMYLQGSSSNQMTVEFNGSDASVQMSVSFWGFTVN